MRISSLLKEKWVELPNILKVGIIILPIIISVASFYIEDYLNFVEKSTTAEIFILNTGLLMLVLGFAFLFALGMASNMNSNRARRYMGYTFNYTSEPVLFGKRSFRMVNYFEHSFRFSTIYGVTSLSAIRTREFFEDVEKEISCEECDREYGDEEGELYIVIEGYIYHILGFSFGRRKIDNVLGFCGKHYDDHSKDNKIKVHDKRNLEEGQKVFIRYDDKTKNGLIKEVRHPDGFPLPSLADEEKHPEEPSELSFDIDNNLIYDESNRLWEKTSSGYKKISENASIYHGQTT